jgi:hypothetical protein
MVRALGNGERRGKMNDVLSVSGGMDQAGIALGINAQAEHCRRNGAPRTAAIVQAQIALMASDTLCGQRIRTWPGLPLEDAMPLRLAGGFHHLLLTGDDARLEPVYAGVVTDQAAVDAIVLAVTAAHDARLVSWFDSPPQTNEAGRSASFMAGLKWLSGRVGPRFELNELGASAGVNTMMDRYFYNLGGVTAGPVASPMHIVPEWRGPPPPDAPVAIVAIRGCDQAPIDLSDPAAALRVAAYVWPENVERMARIRAAIALAAEHAPELVRADAADWVERRLASAQEAGVTRVFHHSIVWQYIPPDRRDRITAAIEAAGARATPERPLAWMMLETNRETFRHELGVRHWPGDGAWHLLGQAQAHGAWVEWY